MNPQISNFTIRLMNQPITVRCSYSIFSFSLSINGVVVGDGHFRHSRSDSDCIVFFSKPSIELFYVPLKNRLFRELKSDKEFWAAMKRYQLQKLWCE